MVQFAKFVEQLGIGQHSDLESSTVLNNFGAMEMAVASTKNVGTAVNGCSDDRVIIGVVWHRGGNCDREVDDLRAGGNVRHMLVGVLVGLAVCGLNPRILYDATQFIQQRLRCDERVGRIEQAEKDSASRAICMAGGAHQDV